MVKKKTSLKKKNPVGRPTKYKPEYCEKIVNFFDREPQKEVEIPHYKNGELSWTDTKLVPCQCPTFEKFAANIRVSVSTLHRWREEYPDFREAFTHAKQLQCNIMLVNGMSGAYNPGFTGLSMKNMQGWRDKTEVEQNTTVTVMPTITLKGGKELIFDVGEKLE